MDKYKEQKDETLKFLVLLEKVTQAKIDLFYMKVEPQNTQQTGAKKKYGRLIVAENVRPREAYYVLKKENAWWKNDMKFENVYWAWSREQFLDVAFVDDIENTERFKELDHFCLIQTSAKKSQALYRLDKAVEPDQLREIQRVLRDIYGGDKSALSAYQLKRMVGFLNTKYPEKPLVRITHVGDKVIDTNHILDYIRKTKERESRFEIVRPKVERQTQTREKTWSDFYMGDASRADISYAHYLLSRGYDRDEIARRLREESPQLRERKYNPDKYIEHTIQKAESYYRPLR